MMRDANRSTTKHAGLTQINANATVLQPMFYPKGFQNDLLEINLRSNYSPEEGWFSCLSSFNKFHFYGCQGTSWSFSPNLYTLQPVSPFFGGGGGGRFAWFLDQKKGAVFFHFLAILVCYNLVLPSQKVDISLMLRPSN